MRQTITQVNAFTDTLFTGNPTAVCLLRASVDDMWMQAVVREMNLSETAFLSRRGDEYHLRWFTPTREVDLCGHATLASAHVLWEKGHLGTHEPSRFRTRSGILIADRQRTWIRMDFPAEREHPAAAPSDLVKALRITPQYVGKIGGTIWSTWTRRKPCAG